MTMDNNNITVWSLHSIDDGKTWAGDQVPHAQQYEGPYNGHNRVGATTLPDDGLMIRAVRVTENNTLVAATSSWFYDDVPYDASVPSSFQAQPADAGVHDTLIVCDISTTPTADASADTVIFKRGENQGGAGWV